MLKNIIFKFCLFLLLTTVLTSCATLQPLEFRSINNVYVTTPDGGAQLAFDLKLYNPNTMGAKLKEFEVEVAINGINLAKAQLLDVTHAGAQSEFIIPVSVTASLAQMVLFLPSGLSMITSGSSIPVHLNGSLTVKKFILKKKFPFTADENIDLTKIRIGK